MLSPQRGLPFGSSLDGSNPATGCRRFTMKSKKLDSKKKKRSGRAMTRAVFLQLPSLHLMNPRQLKKAVRTFIQEKAKSYNPVIKKITWPTYLVREGLIDKWETFLKLRKSGDTPSLDQVQKAA